MSVVRLPKIRVPSLILMNTGIRVEDRVYIDTVNRELIYEKCIVNTHVAMIVAGYNRP